MGVRQVSTDPTVTRDAILENEIHLPACAHVKHSGGNKLQCSGTGNDKKINKLIVSGSE